MTQMIRESCTKKLVRIWDGRRCYSTKKKKEIKKEMNEEEESRGKIGRNDQILNSIEEFPSE